MKGISRLQFLGSGSIGIVWKITDVVAVKRPTNDENGQVQNEYRIYDLLEKHPTCPNIVRSFYRIPSANFMQYMSGGTLDTRLRKRQTRDPTHDIVIDVSDREPACLVWRWMAELTDAVAWLECLGYVHGDLRPSNLLLDGEDHLKIADFDNTTTIGAVFDGLQPPYARILGDEAMGNRGAYGYHGPRTEQFAIGSVIYYTTRGFEPYNDVWLGTDHYDTILDYLQQMIFPPTGDGEIDRIIRNCWYGEFTSIQHLHGEITNTCPIVLSDMAKAMDEVEYNFASQQCEDLVANGILDHAPRPMAILS
ncbi:MAG: hypothetical protein L6R39_000021 [Caloplaca ligustica]|nr:MAG: hypothetical protein L6R39_000021 [Caloplaca ligustica]